MSFRFTEELFAALIALIFIVNAFENIAVIGYTTKFAPETFQLDCKCVNCSSNTSLFPLTKDDCSDLGGKLVKLSPSKGCCDIKQSTFITGWSRLQL